MYKFENWTWCRCWLPLLGIGGVGVHVGGLDVVLLLAAIAGCHCWAAIAGLPLLGAIAGLPLLGIGGGWVYTLADWTWCRCWLPLLGAIDGCQ